MEENRHEGLDGPHAWRKRLQHPLTSANTEWWHVVQSIRRSVDPDNPGRWDPRVIRLMESGLRPVLDTYFRSFVTGLSNIPAGPALYTGVHGGGLISPDLVLAGGAFYRHTNFTRPFYGMAHRMLFAVPVWNRFLLAIGAVEGNRHNAINLLREGHAVAAFPGGEYDMARTFRHRNEVRFAGRTGFVKVALEAGAPIVPMGAIGGHGIYFVFTDGRLIARTFGLKRWFDVSTFPLCVSIPWGVTVSWLPCIPLPARLGVHFGKPMHFVASAREKNDKMYLAYVRDTVEAEVRRLNGELLEGIGHPNRGFYPSGLP